MTWVIRKYADRVVLLDKTVVAQGDANKDFCTDAFREAFGFSFEEVAEVMQLLTIFPMLNMTL